MGMDIGAYLVIGYPINKFITEEFALHDEIRYDTITGVPKTIQINSTHILFNGERHIPEDRWSNQTLVEELLEEHFGKTVRCYFTSEVGDCGVVGIPITKLEGGGRIRGAAPAYLEEVLEKFREAYIVFKDVDEKPKLMLGLSISY